MSPAFQEFLDGVLTAAAMLAGLAALILFLNQGRLRAARFRDLRARLAKLGFEAKGKAMMRRVGDVVVLARSDDSVDLRVPSLRFAVEVYPRDPKQTTHGFIGDHAFDAVHYSRSSAGCWTFHGLSWAVRSNLLELARLGKGRCRWTTRASSSRSMESGPVAGGLQRRERSSHRLGVAGDRPGL